MDRKFLKHDTRVFSLVSSIILSLSLLSIIIIGNMFGNIEKFKQVFIIGSLVMIALINICVGGIQIKVFEDYKNQNSILCADGIIYICLTLLISLCSLGMFYKDARNNMFWIIFVFLILFSIWKIVFSIFNFKSNYKNAILDLILGILWIISAIAFINIDKITDHASICLGINNFNICIISIIYILYSYTFNFPDYLIKKKAIEIYDKELKEEKPIKLKHDKTKDELEEKLNKLKDLKERNILTEEEYNQRRNDIIDKII